MYAFGDVEKPDTDSVALLEDMTMTFLVDLCHRARPQPHKIGIPSNQATINSIASGILHDDASTSATASTNSTAKTVVGTMKDRKAGGGASESSKAAGKGRQAMLPRLAPHPFVGRPRMTVEDLKFACRKDMKTSSRIAELLYLDKVITDAQKTFKNPEEEAVEDKV